MGDEKKKAAQIRLGLRAPGSGAAPLQVYTSVCRTVPLGRKADRSQLAPAHARLPRSDAAIQHRPADTDRAPGARAGLTRHQPPPRS
eukprot:scaffold17968_cov66-Phaeocystis_antarctica.AAC.2